MSILDRLGEGIAVLAVGMVVVFSVLILLWAILLLFKFVFYTLPNKKSAKADIPAREPVVNEPVKAEETNPGISGEIIAAITAAVCASLNSPSTSFRIKSVRRRNNWNKENY